MGHNDFLKRGKVIGKKKEPKYFTQDEECSDEECSGEQSKETEPVRIVSRRNRHSNRKRTETISIRVTPEVLKSLERKATIADVTLSTMLYKSILKLYNIEHIG